MVALLLLGWAVRLPLLARYPFREDESIYAFWALHASYADPYFLTVWPDKPPIFLWLVAGMLALVSPDTPMQSEAAIRWLNVAAALLTVVLVAGMARRWWGRAGGLLAGAALAFNPFAVAFGPTGYTDSMLVLAGTAALVCAVGKRWLWAGLWLGAAIMIKQQGLLYVPLILGLWAAAIPRASVSLRAAGRDTGRDTGKNSVGGLLGLVGGALAVVLPILYWDSLRWAVAPSPWDLAQRTYRPLTFATLDSLPARLEEWARLLWYLGGSWFVWALAVVLSAWAVGRAVIWWIERHQAHNTTDHAARLVLPKTVSKTVRIPMRITAFVVCGLWALGYVAIHMGSTVEIWDRYLLPVAPIFALALARLSVLGLAGGFRVSALRLRAGQIVAILLVGGLLVAGMQAGRGRFPIGADHGDYAGLHEGIAWLQANAGPHYILYHQVFGWHYSFYLFHEQAHFHTQRASTGLDSQPPHEAHVPRQQVDLRWFAGPPGLADNAAKMPYPRKFLLLPAWSPQPHLPLHLHTRGLEMEPRFRQGQIAVVEIVSAPGRACAWCVCRVSQPGWRLARPLEPGIMSQPQ